MASCRDSLVQMLKDATFHKMHVYKCNTVWVLKVILIFVTKRDQKPKTKKPKATNLIIFILY